MNAPPLPSALALLMSFSSTNLFAVNLGESVLRSLFSYWEVGRRALDTKQKHDPRSHTATQPQLNISQSQAQNSTHTSSQSSTSSHSQLQPNGHHHDVNSLKEDGGPTPNHLDKYHLHSTSTVNASSLSTNLTNSTHQTNSSHLHPSSTNSLKGSANGSTNPPITILPSNEDRLSQVCEGEGQRLCRQGEEGKRR